MSKNGIWQLKKVNLVFCSKSRSSSGMRLLIKNDLEKIRNLYPQVTFETIERKMKRPYMLAEYANGRVKPIGVQYMETKDLQEIINKFRNQSGNKAYELGPRVLTKKPSIQGLWHPFLDLDNKVVNEPKKHIYAEAYPPQQSK